MSDPCHGYITQYIYIYVTLYQAVTNSSVCADVSGSAVDRAESSVDEFDVAEYHRLHIALEQIRYREAFAVCSHPPTLSSCHIVSVIYVAPFTECT